MVRWTAGDSQVFAVLVEYSHEAEAYHVKDVLSYDEWAAGRPHLSGRYTAVEARDYLDAYAKAQRGEFTR